MQFIEPNLETILSYLNQLEENTPAKWGKMNAQRMVEHLSESIFMSMGNHDYPLQIPTDKIAKMQSILASGVSIPKDFKVSFAPEEYSLRHEEIELAVDELVDNWIAFEEYYEANPEQTNMHPYYGDLTADQWKRMHQKHFTHHFQQFGLIEE